MYHLQTLKQEMYFDEVIRLHFEKGYGENRIAQVLPIGHTTASRWIAIFAKEKGKISGRTYMQKPHISNPSTKASNEVEALRERIKELESQLKEAEVKAEFYDRMIDVAEAKFRIPIRKKAGAKQ